MRKVFTEMSSWSQLFFLWLFFVIGFFVSGVAVSLLAFLSAGGKSPDLILLLTKSPGFLRVSQIIQQMLLFFIPAVICAYLFNKQPVSYLKLNTKVGFDSILATVFVIFTIQPFVSFTSFYNQSVKFPDFMSGIEMKLKAAEANAAMLTEIMLSGDSTMHLIINLLIVAVMAAVVEEFFFRGVLQQIFRKIFRNHHIAIWTTAFIFSAIHMQFYGFIPRLILGALLGYLFVYTRSLWMPILAHFINNATGVIIFHLYNGTPTYDAIENIGAKEMWWTALISILLTIPVLYYMGKNYSKEYKRVHF